MSFLDPRQWLLVIAFLAAAVLGVKFWEHRLIQQGYDKAQSEYAVKLAKAQIKAAKQAADLQTTVDVIRKVKNDEISTLARSRDAAVAELRKRPERPAGYMPAAASDGSSSAGCSGAELYRSDAEFALRESYRAEQIKVALKSCYAQYEAARSTVNGTHASQE